MTARRPSPGDRPAVLQIRSPADDPSESAPSAGSLVRATAVMGAGTALSRLTGFVRLAVMAWAIGGAESKLPDTYQLANTLPNIVYQLILGEILATVFVPIFVEHVTSRSREETRSLASTSLFLVVGLATAASALAVLAAPWLIKIYTFRLTGSDQAAQEQVGAFFLRIFMPQMIFYAAGVVMTGLLNAHRRFALPMYAPLINNVIVIATFIVFRALHGGGVPMLENLRFEDKLVLAGGTTAGVIAMTLVLLPGVLRLPGGYRFRSLDLHHPALRRVMTLAKYSLLYVAANQAGLYVVKVLANGVQGGVAAYDTSFVLYSLPYGIVAVSVFTALIPTLSEHHVKGNLDSFRNDLGFGLRITSLIMMPAAAGFVVLAEPIVRLLLQYGVFSGTSTRLFAGTFGLMSAGLWAYALHLQIMKAFVSMQDTRTPWLVNSFGVLVNIAAAVGLFPILGLRGLGLAHALSYLSALALAAFVVSRRLGGLTPGLLRWHSRVFVAALLTAFSAYWASRFTAGLVDLSGVGGRAIQVGASAALGLAVYASALALFKVPELRRLPGMAASSLRRSKS